MRYIISLFLAWNLCFLINALAHGNVYGLGKHRFGVLSVLGDRQANSEKWNAFRLKETEFLVFTNQLLGFSADGNSVFVSWNWFNCVTVTLIQPFFSVWTFFSRDISPRSHHWRNFFPRLIFGQVLAASSLRRTCSSRFESRRSRAPGCGSRRPRRRSRLRNLWWALPAAARRRTPSWDRRSRSGRCTAWRRMCLREESSVRH